MLKEVLLERALLVHGNKFDYSLVPDDVVYGSKFPIICAKHGVFYQTTGNHLSNGRGCPTCGFEHVSSIKKEKGKKRFYEEAIKVHGDKYDYSKTVYIDSKQKVIITCPEHGDFQQAPSSHLAGSGCHACGRDSCSDKQRFTTEQFIEKSKEIYGDIFDYSKVEYVKNSVPVLLICKEHGEFSQRPANHLFGKVACQKCMRKNLADLFRLPNEVFLSRVTELHPDLDFSISEYRGAHQTVDFICKVHGELTQKPRHLLMGHGCRDCGYRKLGDTKSKDQSYYIPLFYEIHGDRYDYSKTEFTNSKEKFTVICKEHGEFTSTTDNHLKGKGCPRCGEHSAGFKSSKSGTFYILKVTDNVGKFGISNKFENRLSNIKKRTCFDIEVLYRFDFEDGHIAREIESLVIGSELIQRNVVSKADMRDGYSETFYLKDISKILDIVAKYTPA